ncbi:MAG: response regulator, partial [Lachnospiraceae bacterium]|nr:response regulator [Lachnospiraceae bacterium]
MGRNMYRLVVIDDEAIVVEAVKAMINRLGLNYQVVGFACDGIHGLEVVRCEQPDIVLTDIRMPGLDGLSLIEEAKDFCPDTIFVVISGYTEFEYARRALSMGVKDYIDKPISMEKLRNVLTRIEKDFFLSRDENTAAASGQAALSQAVQEKLGQLFDKSVSAMAEGDAGNFQRYMEQGLEELLKLYESTEDFRREVYKWLCVQSDILTERQPQISRDGLISYQEIAKKADNDEILEYAGKMIRDIARHIEADKTGSSHATILELLAYIEEYYNRDIGLNELADRVGMSTAYL